MIEAERRPKAGIGRATRSFERPGQAGTLGTKWPRVFVALGVFAILLATSCGEVEGHTAERRAAIRRATWRSEIPAAAPVATLANLAVPAGLEPWRVVQGQSRVLDVARAAADDDRGLRFVGALAVFEIPVDAGSPSAARIDLISNDPSELDVEWVGPAGTSRGARPIPGRGALQSIIVPLQDADGAGSDRGLLRIRMRRPGPGSSSWVVQRVRLLGGPLEGLLPDPNGPRTPIMIGTDARPAVGLDARRALAARWPSGAPAGASVEFHVAPLAFDARAGATVEAVLLTGERELARTRVVVPTTERWALGRLTLTESVADLRLAVSFDSASEGDGGPFGCLVTDPEVLDRVEPGTGDAVESILFITSDTHRADHVGLADASVISAAIDQLGREGLWFDHCFSSTNLTIPSHVAMMTGTHPRDTGILNNATRIEAGARTLAEEFQSAGYRTLAVTSSRHLRHPNSGLAQGFDRMSWPKVARRSAEDSIAVLDEWTREQAGLPVFVWLHLFDAHHPYAPPEEFRRLYGADKAPARLLERYESSAVAKRLKPKLYAGEVSYLDSELGHLLEQERWRDGAIVLTADHGENLGEGGYLWNHKDLYPSVIRVPLVLRLPEAGPPRRVSSYASNMDIGRTLLNVAGLEAVPWSGRDLRSLDDRTPSVPIFTLASNAEGAAITVGGWHLILYLTDEFISPAGRTLTDMRHQVRLFDLSRDPACKRDLSSSMPGRARALRAALGQWLLAAQPVDWTGGTDVSAECRAELEELGYVISAVAAADDWFDPDCACEACRGL